MEKNEMLITVVISLYTIGLVITFLVLRSISLAFKKGWKKKKNILSAIVLLLLWPVFWVIMIFWHFVEWYNEF